MLMVERSRQLACDQRGFTLVEMLVALVTGTVITLAVFAMLQATTNQTRLVTDRVQADRLGRQAMTRIVDELHSACIAREAAPIYTASTESKLIFFNAYTEGAEVKKPSEATSTAEGVYVREIVYEPGEKDTGTLKEKVYPSTEVALPSKIVYSSGKPEKTIVIAEHVTQIEKGKEKLPMFEYYKYRKETTNATNAAVTSLEKIPLGEKETLEAEEKTKATNAAGVAGVQINFEQVPTNKETRNEYSLGQGLPLQTQVTLGLGSPAAETPIVDAPCD